MPKKPNRSWPLSTQNSGPAMVDLQESAHIRSAHGSAKSEGMIVVAGIERQAVIEN